MTRRRFLPPWFERPSRLAAWALAVGLVAAACTVPIIDPGAAEGAPTAATAGYIGMFVSALLTATVLPGSAEVVLVALMASRACDPSLLVVAGTAGNTVGAVVNWALGRFLLGYLERRWFPLSPARFARGRAWFARYGIWSLPFSWLPLVGDALTVVAGAWRVGLGRFVALVAAGNAARYAALAASVWWVQRAIVA